MLRSAFAEFRSHPGRFAAVVLAVVLGVGFAAGTLVYTASSNAALGRSVAIEVSKVDVLVTADDGSLDLAGLAAVPGVRQVEPALTSYLDFSSLRSRGNLQLQNVPAEREHRWYQLSSGHWPDGSGEIAVDSGTATRHSLSLGSTLTLGDPPEDSRVTVVAILDTGTSPMAESSDHAYGTTTMLLGLLHGRVDSANIVVDDDLTATQVAERINSTVDGVDAQTSAQVTGAALQSLGNGSDALSIILLAFVALAALVAAMVVANTFTILVTARQRQIALLRCIGATGAQVRRASLVEALLIGLTGSSIGVASGLGVGRIVCLATGIAGQDYRVHWTAMLVTMLAGALFTVVAAIAPTARAMRIAPMAALRPVEDADRVRSAGRVRLSVGLLFLVSGAAVLAGALYEKNLLIAVGGGAVTALGVLVLLRVVLPPILMLIGGFGRFFGISGRLAISNALRNPARAAATCSALVVGVGAVVTLLVAASSAQAGADRAVGERNPLDLQVTATTGILPTGLLTRLAAIDGIAAAVAVPATSVSVNEDRYTLFGPSPTQLAQVRNGGELSAGEVAVPDALAVSLGLKPGDRLTLRRGVIEVGLRIAPRSVADGTALVVLDTDLRRLDPRPVAGAVWAKFDPGATPNDVIAEVNPVVAPLSGVVVSGSGVERAATAEVLNSLIRVALALLAVAVVIALVGIGNTLGLSVIERTRESALLRALGLRRRQLRSMLAFEAVVLATVAAVVGIVFGVLFGFAAVGAAFGEAGQSAVLTVPYGRLGLVLAASVIAGALASALPARRAVRATPTQALVEQ